MDITNSEIIPQNDLPYVLRLRRYLGDTEELNKLEGLEESTNVDLYFALQDSLDEINVTSVQTNYTSFNQVPWAILRLGGVLNVLTSKGILSARNTLTYQDNGGVTVQDYDKYGRYINYFNTLINKYMSSINGWKVSVNVDNCYGGVPSEFSLEGY